MHQTEGSATMTESARIGHFLVEERIGQGGMGVVHRARDLDLKRAVALKFITAKRASDEVYRARFLREARLAASLSHAHR